MCPSLVRPGTPSPSILIALVAVLTLLLSGWTCSAFFAFDSCQGGGAQAQITSLSPSSVLSDATSVLLMVNGSGFAPQSQIMWNGSTLQTTFVDSRHLQTTITQQTFDSFGGSAGSNVQISVRQDGPTAGSGCPKNGDSAPQVLVIN